MMGKEDEMSNVEDERWKRPQGDDHLDCDFVEEGKDDRWAGFATGLKVVAYLKRGGWKSITELLTR